MFAVTETGICSGFGEKIKTLGRDGLILMTFYMILKGLFNSENLTL